MDENARPMSDRRNRLTIGVAGRGLERLSARLYGRAFAPHRHDTYAIGLTVAGVQTFRFRGESWHCLPGQCHILHPDELHDGAAGTEDGFSYRMLYVDPAIVQEALGCRPLPFAAVPVVDARLLREVAGNAIWADAGDADEVAEADAVTAVADLLTLAAPSRPARPPLLSYGALLRVRDFIAAAPMQQHSAERLEAVAGLSRWDLARQFRTAFGTSPSRFRIMRRLDHCRTLLAAGVPLADAAIGSGFSDQSHMTRHFRSTYGLTPHVYASALTST